MVFASKFPAVKILTLVIVGIILGFLLNIKWNFALSFLALSFIILLLSLKFRTLKLAYIFACLAIGFSISSQINWKYSIFPDFIMQDFPVLLNGKIQKIIQNEDSYAKFTLDGTVDAKHLPAISNTRAIVNLYNPEKQNLKLEKGVSITAFGKAKFPERGLLPTDFNETQYCISNDAEWIVKANAKDLAIESEASFFDKLFSNSTNYIKEKIRENHNPENAGIIIALTTGDKSEIPQQTKSAFSLSGTAHVLAVSGLHVGILAAIVFILLSFIENKWVKFLVFSSILIVFVIFTGFQPSAQRAALMAIVAMFVYLNERRIELLNLLCLIVLFLIILYPELILKSAFQMSVASIAGIALLYKPVKKKVALFIKTDRTYINYIVNSIALTISISILVAPIVAFYFNVFSIISPITNIIVIPAITIAMIFALIELAFSPIIPIVASIYASASDLFITLAKEASELSASIPYFYIANNSAFVVSVLISSFFIYLITANNKRLLAFRAFIGAVIVSVSLIILLPQKSQNIEIIPRKLLTAVIVPSSQKGTFVLLADRKPAQQPFVDYCLVKYLLSLDKPLYVGYTGNASIAVVDKIKFKKLIRFNHIPLNILNRIENLMNLKEKITKVIKY